MKKLDWYILRQVAGTTLVVMSILILLDTFFNFLRELENLGKGDYNFYELLFFLLLTLPRRSNELLPLALLIGGLFSMGALAASSELVVMRAAGLSPLRLARAALVSGLCLSAAGMILGEFIAPHSERLAQQMRAQAKQGSGAVLGHGFWARDGRFIVHIGAVIAGPKLLGISIFELDDDATLRTVTEAKTAEFVDGRWQLQTVTKSAIQPESVVRDDLAAVDWDSVINPDTLDVLVADPEDLALSELQTYISYLQNSSLDASRYQLAFWVKASAPLTNLSLLFVALTFSFAPLRKTGAGQRLLMGVLLGLVFFLLSRMLGNGVLLLGYPPLIGAVTPALLFFAGGWLALRKTN